jgi:surfeit locus 1 family protein
VLTAAAQHEEQCCSQAAQNGHKSNDYKVCHEQDYLVSPRIRVLVFGGFALIGIAITLSLGCWQLDRAAQKEALASAIQLQGEKSPLDTRALLAPADLQTLVHQPARLRGTWLPEFTVFLDNRQMGARVGFFVLTPLRLEGSDQVLIVQRGWVPRNFEERAHVPPVDTPSGVVPVSGRIALPPSKLYEPGTPGHTAIRQNLDLVSFRQEIAQPLLTSVTLLQTGVASEGLSRDWPVVNLGVDKHYGYAAQWFALALLVAVLYAWFQIRPYLRYLKDHHV